MAITIAIIGRPNAGKSTLFNRLTRSRNALVSDQPGVTRDRHYGFCDYEGRTFILIDTGGLYDISEPSDDLAEVVTKQSFLAIKQADAVFWLIDGREELTSLDEYLAGKLRPLNKPIYLLVNKAEGLDKHMIPADYHSLGIADPLPVSAKRGSGISSLMDRVIKDFPADPDVKSDLQDGLHITLLGRPNVGKSTLTNRILGEERMLTYERPGTTRDSISIQFERQGRHLVLIDTAGVRRRSRVGDSIEKLSILKTIEALDKAQIVILVIDAREGLTEQDMTLLGMTAESGKPLIIAVNKWDGLNHDQKSMVKNQLDRKLGFAGYACIHFISALHGTGVGNMFKTIDKISRALNIDISASTITQILQTVTTAHQPPLINGRRIKLRYAHLGGHNPIRVIIHGNQTEKVPDSYRRYLASSYQKELKLTGTPVLIEFKRSDNPYKGKKNVLTRKQVEKRQRLIKHARKK